uniref:C2H2-type domain-containing protein n=1 Tax=Panagrolaimus sp. ES5 TaxID=591445 RepID=A0AC34GF19_9BILA
MCKSNGKFRDTSLRQHLFDIHDIEAAQTKLLCRFCDFIPPPNTTSQQALSIGRHVKREHSHYQTAMEENLRYKCTFAGCKEQYPTANGLASHQKSHKKAAADITKELKEILPSIRNRQKAVDEKLNVNQTQSQLLSQAPSDSFQPPRDSDVDDNEHEMINIS